MKILQLGKAYPPVNLGGVEIVIELLSEGLNANAYECDALGVNGNYSFEVDKGKFGGLIYRTKLLVKAFSTLFSLQLIVQLFKLRNNYDIIHIHAPDPMAAFALFICRPKTKIVLHWHSDILKQKFLLFFYSPIQRWLLKRADLILVTSPPYLVGSKVLEKFRSKVKVLPIGIPNPVQSCVTPSVPQALKNEIGEKKIVFSLGRLAYYKGFEYLILAAKDMPENYLIVIAGDGNERARLVNLIQANGLTNKVKLIGKISDGEKDWLYRHASLFALSSIYKTEAYAIVQVEALAYGMPIVSTQIPGSGVDWVNANGLTGITVPIMNSKALSRAVIDILSHQEKYDQFKSNAVARYHDLFTQDVMIKQLIAYYQNLTHGLQR